MEKVNNSKLIALQFNGHGFTISSLELLVAENRKSLEKGRFPNQSVIVGVFNFLSEAEDCMDHLDELFEKRFDRTSPIGK